MQVCCIEIFVTNIRVGFSLSALRRLAQCFNFGNKKGLLNVITVLKSHFILLLA